MGMASSSLLFPIPLAAIRGDIPHPPLISFRDCSLDLTGMANWWASQCGPILPARWYVGDKSSLSSWCDHKGWFSDALSLYGGPEVHAQPSCVFHLQAQVITPVLSPGCVNGLRANVFIFDTSQHVHISFQAWKRGQGPWSLTHSLSVTSPQPSVVFQMIQRGSCMQLCVTFKWREPCHRALAFELCSRDLLIIIVFFSLLDICPLPSQCEGKSHYSC